MIVPIQTKKEFCRLLVVLQSTVQGFPDTSVFEEIALNEIASFVGVHGNVAERLEWFGKAIARHFRTWGFDCSLPALRALYCTHYDPADGHQPTVVLPGYSPDDMEARWMEKEQEDNDKRLLEFQRLVALNPAEYAVPLELPAPVPKHIPEPNDGTPRGPEKAWDNIERIKRITKSSLLVRNGTLKEEESRLIDQLLDANIPDDEQRRKSAAALETEVLRRLAAEAS